MWLFVVSVLGALPLVSSGFGTERGMLLKFKSVSVTLPSMLGSLPFTSLCSGDECIGEADFLLPLSLPPRDEFRGETLPVCRNTSLSVSDDEPYTISCLPVSPT